MVTPVVVGSGNKKKQFLFFEIFKNLVTFFILKNYIKSFIFKEQRYSVSFFLFIRLQVGCLFFFSTFVPSFFLPFPSFFSSVSFLSSFLLLLLLLLLLSSSFLFRLIESSAFFSDGNGCQWSFYLVLPSFT